MKSPFPPNIKHIRVIAPAGAVEVDKMNFNRQLIESFGINVSYGKHLFGYTDAQLDYTSASIMERLEDLHDAYKDNTVDLVLCARGGFGTPQLLPYIDWDLLRSRGKMPLLGYSDITALQLAMSKFKIGRPIPSLHLNFFSESIAYDEVQNLLKWSIAPHENISLEFKPTLFQKSGKAEGPIYSVNLSMLETLVGTSYLPDLSGTILLVEEISEPVRKIDRFFTHLLNAGILSNLNGLLLGYFTDCQTPAIQHAFFKSLAEKINCPMGSGIQFGHERPSIPIANGTHCAINISTDKTEVTLYAK